MGCDSWQTSRTIHSAARSTTPRVRNWPCQPLEFGASHGNRGAGCACGRAEDALAKYTLTLIRVYDKTCNYGTQLAIANL